MPPGRLSRLSTQWARVPRAAPAHTSETPLTHSETKQKHVTTTKSDLSSSAKRRAGLDAMAPRVPARPHHHPSPTERVDDVAPFNTTDRSRELVPRACHLPPSFPNKCNGSPRRPRLQQDRASTPPNVGHDAPSGTEASQKQNAATQYPHPTHPARHPRHESDGRVAPRPNAASQDHKFPQALRNSPRSALAPASTAHLLRGHHALVWSTMAFVKIATN